MKRLELPAREEVALNERADIFAAIYTARSHIAAWRRWVVEHAVPKRKRIELAGKLETSVINLTARATFLPVFRISDLLLFNLFVY